MKTDIHRDTGSFREPKEDAYAGLNVLHKESRGIVDLLIIRNRRELEDKVISRRKSRGV